MKKKLILCLSIFLLYCFMFIQPTKAEEYYYEEVIEIIDSTPVTRSTNTITGKKTASVKNSSDQVLWSVTVTGTFTYTGTKATCTSSSVSATTYDRYWKIKSQSSSKSSNKAIGTAIAENYFEGKVVLTQTKNVTLTCSASGKLS